MIKIFAKKGAPKVAEILIYEVIGEDWYGNGLTAKRFDDDLKALGEITDIKVRINSPGGSVFDGIAIYNILKQHAAKVHVQVDGLAASAASIIAMAGDVVSMGIGTQMMIHNPWTFAMGDSNAMRKSAEVLDQIREGMVAAYAAKSGLEHDELIAIIDAETWYGPEAAIAAGFADAVVTAEKENDEDDESKATAQQSWQAVISRFKNTPSSFKVPQFAAAIQKSAAADASGANAMTPEEIAAAKAAEAQNAEQIKAAALAAEADRQSAIRQAFVGAFATDHRELLDACLQDQTCTAAAASQKLLKKLGEGSESLRATIQPNGDSRDKFIAGVANAILARRQLETLEGGNEWAGASLGRIARAVLHRAGVAHADRLEGSNLAAKVFATMSTSDFPLLLSNTANKALRKAYEAAPSTWQTWCGVGEVSDFKSNSRIQLGSFNSLAVIPEGGEYKAGTFGEEAETIQAQTKGRALFMTRQMIINDDLGGFVSRAQKLGIAAKRTVNEDVYSVLAANPNMSDSGALFNATAASTPGGHANYTTPGTAISVASIGVGEYQIGIQKDTGRKTTLNLSPAFLLAPRAKRLTAWEILNSTSDPASSNSNKKNYAASLALEIVSDAELDKASGTAWYLVTDPNVAPVIEVDFLDGVQTPFTDEMVDFFTDAIVMKVRLDYGVAPIDWRGGYKNAGA